MWRSAQGIRKSEDTTTPLSAAQPLPVPKVRDAEAKGAEMMVAAVETERKAAEERRLEAVAMEATRHAQDLEVAEAKRLRDVEVEREEKLKAMADAKAKLPQMTANPNLSKNPNPEP